MILVFFFLRLKRCQVNDCKPSGTRAYGWKRPSRAKTAADHPVSPLPPPKGWGKIKEVFKAFRERGVVPNWTAYRKAQVTKWYKPWMHLHMLRALRGVPVQVTWRKYCIEKDWCGRVPKGTPGPPGLHGCVWVCKNLQPGMRVPGFGPKKRRQAAWTYARFLKKELVRRGTVPLEFP